MIHPNLKKVLLSGMTFFYLLHFLSAQDQQVADSLRIILESKSLKEATKLEVLRNLAFNEVNDLELSLAYSDQLIDLAKQKKDEKYLAHGYLQKGYKQWNLGDLDQALRSFIVAVEHAQKANFLSGEGAAYCAMADIYSGTNSHTNAMTYYHKAIKILESGQDPIALATTYLNAGDEFYSHETYDSALVYFSASSEVFEKINHLIGKAYNLGNIGMVYASTGQNEQAEKNINEAIAILEKAGDFYPICFYLISMADVFLDRGDINSAITYAEKSLTLAKQHELKQQISDAHQKLSELYQKLNQPVKALNHYKVHIAFRDSVNNLESIQNIADQRTEFEVSLREKEIEVLEKDKQLQTIYIIVALVLLIAFILLFLLSRQRLITNKLATKAERNQHEKEVQNLLQGQEKKTLQSMIEGREKERKHLAGELHNHLGSLLATVKMNLNGIEQEDDRIKTLHQLVDQVYNDVRNMSHALNMGVSEDFGLVSALKELVAHLSQSGKLKVEFNAAVTDCAIPIEQEIVLYRVVQELVSNVLKHAKATEMTLLLTCFEDDQLLNIMVSDNGKGFEVQTSKAKSDGMGLQSLAGMVESLHGEMEIDSQPGRGTTINIDFPLDESLTENPVIS